MVEIGLWKCRETVSELSMPTKKAQINLKAETSPATYPNLVEVASKLSVIQTSGCNVRRMGNAKVKFCHSSSD